MKSLIQRILLIALLPSCGASEPSEAPYAQHEDAVTTVAGPGIIPDPQGGAQAIILQEDKFRRSPGSLEQMSSDGSNIASSVQIARMCEPFFIGATRTPENQLKLTLYEMDEPGNIIVHGVGTDTPTITDFSITRVPVTKNADDDEVDMLVVAARTSAGKLRLTLWRLDRDDKALVLEDTLDGGDTTLVAVTGAIQEASTYWQSVEEVQPLRQIVVATSTPASGNKLKLIPYLVDTSLGTIERIGPSGSGTTIDLALSEAEITALDRPFGTLVTAGRRSSDGKLVLSSFTIDGTAWTTTAPNPITHRSTAVGEQVRSVAATTLSHGRIGVALRTQSSKHKVATWNIDTNFQLSQRAAATWGDANGPIAIASASGSMLFSISSGRIQSWDASGAIVPLDFTTIPEMSTATSGKVVDLAHLRPDRPVAGYIQADGKRKVVSLQNWSIPVLRGEWPWQGVGPAVSPAPPPPADNPNMAPVQVSELGVTAKDLSVAVGRKAVLVMDGNAKIAFYDRAGARLPSKNCLPETSSCTSGSASVIRTSLALEDLFASVLEPTLPNGVPNAGQPNEQALRYHMSVQKHCDPRLPPGDRNQCGSSPYDGRAIYDDTRQRFIVMIGLKPIGNYEGSHHGIAVSKTDDPRDGFYVYVVLEQKTTDMPRIGVGGNMLFLGNSIVGPFAASALHVYHLDALASPNLPAYQNHIPSTKLPARAINLNTDIALVNPAHQYGVKPYGIVYGRPNDSSIQVFAIPNPWGAPLFTDGPPSVASAEPFGDQVITLPSEVRNHDLRGEAFVRLFPAGTNVFDGYLIVSAVHGPGEARYVKVARAPFRIDHTEVTGSGAAKVYDMGRQDPASCLMPAAVEQGGKTVVSYLRTSGTGSVPADAAYDVLDSNFSKTRTSMLTSGVVSSTPRDVDTTASAPDPIDGTVWILQVYGNTTTSGAVVLARVHP
jgi:hypothetical protein